jgi:hypothetical protein
MMAMTNVEKRLRQRIRNTFARELEEMKPADVRRFEDEVLSLIKAFGAAQNGTRDAVYDRGVKQMRQVLGRRTRQSSTSAAYQ